MIIKAAILNKQKLGHKVQPMKNGDVFVFGKMATTEAKKLAEEGLIEYISYSETSTVSAAGYVHQGVCKNR